MNRNLRGPFRQDVGARLRIGLLPISVALGAMFGALGAVDSNTLPSVEEPLSAGTVARVNNVSVPIEIYFEILRLIANDRSARELTRQDRVFALERLIEEEVIVQAALRNNLIRTNDRLRRGATEFVLRFAIAEGDQERAFDELMAELRDRAQINEYQAP